MIIVLIYMLSTMGTLICFSVYEDDLKELKNIIDVEKVVVVIAVIPLLNTFITVGSLLSCGEYFVRKFKNYVFKKYKNYKGH